MSARFTETEAKMYAALLLLAPDGEFGADCFFQFEGVTPERAQELESYKENMSEEEAIMITDCLPPIKGLPPPFRKKGH